MADALRDRQPLRVLAENRQVIELAEEIGSFERLVESIERDFAALGAERLPAGWRHFPVLGRLEFAPAAAGEGTATGRLTARVPAVCQRCLEPLEWPLDIGVDVRFTTGTEAAGSPGDRGEELWELEDERLRPVDVVDELLVMALPLSVRHEDDGRCGFAAGNEERHEPDTTRPFAGLKARMGEAGRK